MDGVQMHLSASVGTKLLDQEVARGTGDPGFRDSISAVAGDLRILKASSGNFPKDAGFPSSSGLLGSYPPNKKEFDCYEKYGSNGRNQSSGEINTFLTTGSKPESKNLQKKSGRRSNSSPSSKRPRTDSHENSLSSFIVGCTSSETSRLLKQKVGPDGKRCDRKNSRVTGKSKIDSFTVRNGLSCSDITAGGNHILGTYSLKPDTRDVTKDVEEPSLAALLDGSYKCPILCQEKVKKVSSANDSIFHSFTKACSILNASGISSNRENSTFPAISGAHPIDVRECQDSNKCIGESGSCSKFTNLEISMEMKSIRPHVVFERLALPASYDLDYLLRNQNVLPVNRLHRNNSLLKACGASLPPFAWSSSQCKPPLDTGKLGLGRSLSQGRWVRIGRNASVVKNDCSSSQLDSKLFDHITNSQKYKELLHDAKTLTMSYSLPPHSLGISCNNYQVTKSGLLMNKRFIVCSGQIVDLSADYEHGLKLEKDICSITGDVGSLSIIGVNKANSADIPSVNNSTPAIRDLELEHPMKASCSGIDPYKKQSCEIPASESRKSGHSPRLLVAAEILFEMGRLDIQKTENSSGKTRWPNSPLQMTMKARKVRPLTGKCEGSSLEKGLLGTPMKAVKLPSSQSKPMASDDRRDTLSLKSDGREPVRWSAVSERSYHVKIEELSTNLRQSHGTIRQVDLQPPPKRSDKSREAHHKPRKDGLATTSYASGTIFPKNWSRGKRRD